MSQHGGGVRGDSLDRRSSSFEGLFGRIFRSLPPAKWPKQHLIDLGLAMTADAERDEKDPNLPAASPEVDDKRIQDDEENAGIPAGYTYLGQFIDHDITFDPVSSLMQQNDPDALVDFRTPRLDLDSVYGRGPADQPFMYLSDGKRLRLGRQLTENGSPSKARDLPRVEPAEPGGAKRALIGDKRNDENVIVAQLHSTMLKFHNKLADLGDQKDPASSFEDIQQQVRWTYQWIVVNDFLIKICGRDVVESILPHLAQIASPKPIWENPPKFAIYKVHEEPFIPIEFSAAAYRFGHSMVRPIYRLNTKLDGGTDPEKQRGLGGRFFIFAGVQERGLNGFGEFPDKWGIDWSLFFDINGSIKNNGKTRVQPAYKIDTSLVNPLGFLPEFSKKPLPPTTPLTVQALQSQASDPQGDPSNLAVRNLLRGMSMELPSGQSVARSLGLEPITDENLRIGKAVVEDWDKNKPLFKLHKSFTGNAPLWFYILAEAQWEWIQRAKAKGGQGDETPLRLGAVGARIVAETLIGLLWGDGHSYLRQAPNWQPENKIRSMGDLINFAS
jgi:hypothetical protein